MRLVTLLIIFSLLGCKAMPVKPVVTVCVIDYPRSEAICGETKNPDLLVLEEVRRIPLSMMDRATAFTPSEWEKVQVYVHRLEDYANEACE